MTEPKRLPLLFRLLRESDLLVFRLIRLWGVFRDAVAWTSTSDSERAVVTAGVYSKMSTFNPGGEVFEGGLYDWEKALLEEEVLPKSGSILLTASGGGREIRALCEKGYAVWGFEPADALAEGSRKTVEKVRNAYFLQASYNDFIHFYEPQGAQLQKWIGDQRFDIVWLGQGSFTHVTTAEARAQVFRVARRLAPKAKVVVSAFASEHPDEGQMKSVRSVLTRLLHLLGCRGTFQPGDGFSFHGGFFHQFTRAEVYELARSTGYEVELYWTIPQGQFAAVLRPASESSGEPA